MSGEVKPFSKLCSRRHIKKMKQYYCEIKASQRGYKGCNGLYVKLYVNGQLAGSCSGGGYDMTGVCFGEWLTEAFKLRLWKLAKEEATEMRADKEKTYNDKVGGIYGLILNKDQDGHLHIYADGATGISQMWQIIGAMGGKVEQLERGGDWLNKWLIRL